MRIKGKAIQGQGRDILKVVCLLLITVALLTVAPGILQTASAAGLLPEQEQTDYLFDRYPIKNYSLDVYVDGSGKWLPWNWGDAATDAALSILLFLLNIIYSLFNHIYYVVGILVQELFNLDLIEALADKVTVLVQKMAGWDARGQRLFESSGLFPQLLVLTVILMGCWLMWTALLKRDTSRAVSGLSHYVITFVLALALFMNAATIVKGANDFSTYIQGIVSSPITSVFGMDADVGTSIREQYFNTTVYEPYLLMQYDTTEVAEEKVALILSESPGSKEREGLVEKEVSDNKNELMKNYNGLSWRMICFFLLGIVNFICTVVVVAFVALGLFHQIAFLFYFALSPFILIASMLPGSSLIAVRWLKKALYELLMKVLITALVTIMFGFSSLVMSLFGLSGYLLTAILQVLLFIGVFFFRGKIMKMLVMPDAEVPKDKSFRNMAAAAYMLGRGSKPSPEKPASPPPSGGSNDFDYDYSWSDVDGERGQDTQASLPENNYGLLTENSGNELSGKPDGVDRGGSGQGREEDLEVEHENPIGDGDAGISKDNEGTVGIWDSRNQTVSRSRDDFAQSLSGHDADNGGHGVDSSKDGSGGAANRTNANVTIDREDSKRPSMPSEEGRSDDDSAGQAPESRESVSGTGNKNSHHAEGNQEKPTIERELKTWNMGKRRSKNQFHNFNERGYDYNDLEQRLLNRQRQRQNKDKQEGDEH